MLVQPASTYSFKLILNIAFSLTAVGVVVRALSALKEIVFASAYGASAETDAFVLAFTYATFLPGVLGAALSTALIAGLADATASLRGRNLIAVAKRIAVSAFVCAVLVYGLAPYVLAALFGLEGAALESTISYARVLAPLGGTMLLSFAMNALLNSGKQFYVAAIAPLATPAAIMLAIFLAAGRWGVRAAAWGTVLGGIAELLVLGTRIYSQRRRLLWTPDRESSGSAKWFWRAVGVLSIADALAAISPMIDQIFLARLDIGAITHFSYASKVNSVLIGIFGTAFTVTIFPYLSELAAQRNIQALRALAWRLGSVLLPMTLLATSLVYVYSNELVHLLFGRGNFTAEDVLQVATIQRVLCFQLVFYVALLLAMSMLNALRATRFVLFSACIGLVSNALFDWLLYEKFGAAGVALSSVLTSMLGLICAALFIKALLARIIPNRSTP